MEPTTQQSPSSFAQALQTTDVVAPVRHVALSATHKTLLACVIVFILPLMAGALIPLRLLPTSSLSASAATRRTSGQLNAAVLGTSTDVVAVADQFLNRAKTTTDLSLRDRFVASAADLMQSDASVSQDATQVRTNLQAYTESTQRIAAPGETTTTSFTTSKTTNGKQGSVVLKSGSSTVRVAYPSLKDGTQLYLQSEGNADNSVVYVASKTPGVGFEIGATSAVTQDVSIRWYDVTNQ